MCDAHKSMRLLLDHGVPVDYQAKGNISDFDNEPALFRAASGGANNAPMHPKRVQTMKILVRAGASLTRKATGIFLKSKEEHTLASFIA
jgi:hypothetical protein